MGFIMNLSNILREDVELYKSQMIQKMIRLLRQWDTGIAVYSDGHSLSLVTRGLTANTFFFTHEGGKVMLQVENIESIQFLISEQERDPGFTGLAGNVPDQFEKRLDVSMTLKLLEENDYRLEIESLPDADTYIHLFIQKRKCIRAVEELKSREVQITVG